MNTTRRDFMKKASAASIGLTLGSTTASFSAKSYKNIIGVNKIIKHQLFFSG
ncbi:MAG: twin-arginine translocation signal domain-containing protein [Bacteroidota bacterium]|nr:twin-arginine translocation signal domain-containing protein [Bacteroidota bacterium]